MSKNPNIEKTLPQCIESENAVICGLLLENFTTDLQPIDFYATDNQLLMESIRAFKNEHPAMKPDLAVFLPFLNSHTDKNGESYQAKLDKANSNWKTKFAFTDELTSQIFNYHCGLVKDCAKRRATISELYEATEKAYDQKKPIDDTIKNCSTAFSHLNNERKLPFRFYNAGDELYSISEKFTKNHNAKPIKTKFNYLDSCLGNGFHAGELIELGGMTGMCKTSFCLALTANLLEQGHSVLYVALEMFGEELIAKLESLYMHQIAFDKDYGHDKYLKNTLGYKAIQYANIPDNLSQRYADACLKVNKLVENLYIAEGTATISIDDVVDLAKQLYLKTGKMPVIFIDYMQLLTPHYEKATDKVNADYNILKMKQLATGNGLADVLGVDASELKTIVLTIVANNRTSNAQTATESSGRDSSSLEYTCDVLFSLEPSELKNCQDGNEKDNKKQGQKVIDETKSQPIKELDLKIVKNRSKNPPTKRTMPAFKVFHGAYFLENNPPRN